MTILESSHMAETVAFYGIVVSWWIFGLTIWLRKRPPEAKEEKRDGASLIGLALQAAAYFIVWRFPLQKASFSFAGYISPVASWALALLAVAIAGVSVWLVNSAARHLGKQWALSARVVEGHALIQDGPYRFVRNPIYTGMFGLLLATGIAAGQWIPLMEATVLFAAGTYIRIHREERLLREAFGAEFEAYSRKVPAIIPGIC